jgi:hypothetical protein
MSDFLPKWVTHDPNESISTHFAYSTRTRTGFPRDGEHGFHGNVNADPPDRERFGAACGAAFMIAEGRIRWLEIDRKAERVIWGFLPPGSAVDAEREDLHVEVEAADRAANQ